MTPCSSRTSLASSHRRRQDSTSRLFCPGPCAPASSSRIPCTDIFVPVRCGSRRFPGFVDCGGPGDDRSDADGGVGEAAARGEECLGGCWCCCDGAGGGGAGRIEPASISARVGDAEAEADADGALDRRGGGAGGGVERFV